MTTFAAPLSRAQPLLEVLVGLELVARDRLRLALVRRHQPRLGGQRQPQRLALGVDHSAYAPLGHVADHVRVKAGGHLARQRPGEHHHRHGAGQVAHLLDQRLQLGGGHFGAVLVDLGLQPAGRVDHRGRRPRLAADPHEIVEDALAGKTLDDLDAGTAAGQARGDHGIPQPFERASDVDALPPWHHDSLLRPVPVTELKVRDGQRLVDRGIDGDCEDHPLGRESTRRNSPPLDRGPGIRMVERCSGRAHTPSSR